MTIDNCLHKFEKLAETVLPAHLRQLRKSMSQPMPIAEFAIKGVGTKTLLKKYSHANDFSGCYVLIENKRPIYVGISRTVFQRLMQHVKGKTHYDASLAYRIAVSEHEHVMTRSGRMENRKFKKLFANAKTYLVGLDVAYVKIENPLELYVFEPFCAMKFDTHQWNTFRTH